MIINVIDYLRRLRIKKDWERQGKPVPPPETIKQDIVKDYAARFSIRTFIETGTYQGHMVRAVRRCFERIWSVELDSKLFHAAQRRFRHYKHISILHGDSGKVLPEILSILDVPCLFWLDSHYSGGETAKGEQETPIRRELVEILTHPAAGHVILIDDARCFNGTHDYPSLDELDEIIRKVRPSWIIEVKDDIIRAHQANR